MGMRTPPGEVYSQKMGKNKKATLLRLFKFVVKDYKFSFITVFVFIIVSSCATLMSTLFTKTLIDDYIKPLQGVDNPDFSRSPQSSSNLRRCSSSAWPVPTPTTAS